MRTLALCCLLGFFALAQAQPYPSRPVRMGVPLSPGGFADTPTRMLEYETWGKVVRDTGATVN